MTDHVPTEREIRDMAKRLGYADENGDYPRSRRAQLAVAVVELHNEEADDAERAQAAAPPLAGTTVAQLRRFSDELRTQFDDDVAASLLLAVAPAVVRRHGLHVNPKELHS